MTKAHILIAEDEALIAMMLEDYADALGYGVAATVDTVEAGLGAVDAADFELAILDVNLKNGAPSWPIADALDAAAIPCIFTSGGDDEQPPDRHREKLFLHKPFTLEMLEKALNSQLSS